MKTRKFFSVVVVVVVVLMVLSLISVSASAQTYRSIIPVATQQKELKLVLCVVQVENAVATISIEGKEVAKQAVPEGYKKALTATSTKNGGFELASFERKGNALNYTSLTSDAISTLHFISFVTNGPKGLSDKDMKKLGKALEKNSIFF